MDRRRFQLLDGVLGRLFSALTALDVILNVEDVCYPVIDVVSHAEDVTSYP